MQQRLQAKLRPGQSMLSALSSKAAHASVSTNAMRLSDRSNRPDRSDRQRRPDDRGICAWNSI